MSHVDLAHADLFGADLRGVRATWLSLLGADIERAALDGASFIRSTMNAVHGAGATLNDATLRHVKLDGALLPRATLDGADLGFASLVGADLRGASAREVNLNHADLERADLEQARMAGGSFVSARLVHANLSHADLSGADITYADLRYCRLVEADLSRADLSGCTVYGTAAWDVRLEGATQTALVVSAENEPEIRVDDLEVAQLVHLLLRHANLRRVLDLTASSVVLILGRFSAERLSVLHRVYEELKGRGYVPVIFDFEKPSSRDLTETISTLAHLARFVVADLTDARSIPQELSMIVPDLPSVPIQPLIAASDTEYAMFEHLQRFPWVLPVHRYADADSLVASFEQAVIAPAERRLTGD